MFQESQIIEIDANDIKFCCGPCFSNHPEPEPTWLGNNNGYHYVFKPYSGKKYAPFNWPLPNNGKIVVKNLRVCEGCHRRYNDDEFDEEDLIRDGLTVLDKLKNHANI